MSKPFDPDVLRAKVRVLVERSVLRRTVAEQAEQLALRLEERDRAQAALAEQTHELERSNAELERFAEAAARALRDPLLTAAGFLDLLGEDVARRARRRRPPWHRAHPRRARRPDPLRLRWRPSWRSPRPSGSTRSWPRSSPPGRRHSTTSAGRWAAIPCRACTGDRWQLVQLLGEVLDNAIAFRSDVDLRVHVSVSRRGDHWVVTVRDNGVGIPPADLPRLFTVFARPWGAGDRAGSGLGLATCRRIVERHGGEMWAESVPDRGAAISFSLPAA